MEFPGLKEPEKCSREFSDFVGQCLKKDTAERPEAKELLSHPFLQKSCSSEEFAKLIAESQAAKEQSSPFAYWNLYNKNFI